VNFYAAGHIIYPYPGMLLYSLHGQSEYEVISIPPIPGISSLRETTFVIISESLLIN